MRLTCICAFLLAMMQMAGSQELLGDPELRNLSSASSPPASATQLMKGSLFWSEARTRDALLRDLGDWLSRNEGLPPLNDLPRIAYASPEAISAMRYRALLGSKPVAASPPAAAVKHTTVAIYVDDQRTVYLLDDFKGRTAADLSVVVHELVHHIQQAAGLRYECPQAREKEAYLAQDHWLRQFGTSLLEEFAIDPFTILVNSLCGY
jgi:hypothetical protein